MSEPGAAAIETPSGKDAAYENFPVGSWLLPAELRPHIAVFYAFARAIDDIADNPDLKPEDKIERLSGFADALQGRGDDAAYPKAASMRLSLEQTNVTGQHCLDLIAAFKQDAVKGRYDDWDDLMGYCILSAAPVGRYLLDLHGGSADGYGPSDALCMALQVINHLQDCRDDYVQLDRVYLPGDWMNSAGVRPEDLDRNASTPELRNVLDRTLAGVDGLMVEAHKLPGGLRSKRLAMESAAILRIAERLIEGLRARDPLPRRVELTKAGYFWCCIRGAASELFG